MTEEKDFVQGMLVKRPHENAPDFIKASISIKRDEFKEWFGGVVKDNPDDEWVNIDIKESRKGNLYAERNTYKAKEKQAPPDPKPEPVKETDAIPW